MGCDAEIVVLGGRTLAASRAVAASGLRLLADLESVWSRFLRDSDVSNINRHAGDVVHVQRTTCELVRLACSAWHLTNGAFDPTVGAVIAELGYDRTFVSLPATRDPLPTRLAGPAENRSAPGCGGVEIDSDRMTVGVPVGVQIDLGGIGKGFAGDLVVEHVLERGAEGVLVNIGGDVRVGGVPPDGAWVIDVEHPSGDGAVLDRWRIVDGAIAVSSTTTRRWMGPKGSVHHVIDPFSGTSTDAGLCGVAVLAGTGWWAEALTKAVLVAGAGGGLDVVESIGHGAHAMTIGDDGVVGMSPGLGPFRALSPSSSVVASC